MNIILDSRLWRGWPCISPRTRGTHCKWSSLLIILASTYLYCWLLVFIIITIFHNGHRWRWYKYMSTSRKWLIYGKNVSTIIFSSRHRRRKRLLISFNKNTIPYLDGWGEERFNFFQSFFFFFDHSRAQWYRINCCITVPLLFFCLPANCVAIPMVCSGREVLAGGPL